MTVSAREEHLSLESSDLLIYFTSRDEATPLNNASFF